MKKLAITALLAGAPLFAFAQGLGNIQDIVEDLGNIVALLIPIAAGLAVLFFFWGLALFILAAGDEEKRKKSRGIMLWGIIAIFIVASIWGIIGFLNDALGIDSGSGTITPPTIGGL